MNEPVIVPPRRSLTRRQRVKLFDLRGGICGIREPWIDEHMIPREISADDSIDNHWPLHVGAPVRPNRPPMMMLCALSTDGRARLPAAVLRCGCRRLLRRPSRHPMA